MVDSQGLASGATVSTPVAGGLILLTGNLGSSSKATRSTAFDLIVDTTKVKSCPSEADRPIKGALGLLEWQKWLIDTVSHTENNDDLVPFKPQKASFTVSFEINNTGSLGPKFTNIGAGALDSGSGSLSQGRKTTHKIVVVASSLFDRPKTVQARKVQDKNLLQDLQQRVLTETLRRIE